MTFKELKQLIEATEKENPDIENYYIHSDRWLSLRTHSNAKIVIDKENKQILIDF